MRDIPKTVGNLIDKASNTFISYIDDDGFPVTKAMLSPREREGLHTFYFSTNTSSNKVRFFRENQKCSIYFVDKRFFRGVSLSGTIEVLEDAESKKRIWKTGDTLYYKGGVTDPDYCVLRLTVTKGRFYSNFKSEDFEVSAQME
ncbi:pyridoxamine 5'-phosphate oxidase family protein [Oscillospiraceae bacterium MB08-C2-2]|nr:pyridoxamine 5'-phosphate oxidase family protein [Oscillospiraceae bacterium MB08-C2-2]